MEQLDPAKYDQVEWVSSTRRIGDGYEPVTTPSPGSERSESGCLMYRNAQDVCVVLGGNCTS